MFTCKSNVNVEELQEKYTFFDSIFVPLFFSQKWFSVKDRKCLHVRKVKQIRFLTFYNLATGDLSSARYVTYVHVRH